MRALSILTLILLLSISMPLPAQPAEECAICTGVTGIEAQGVPVLSVVAIEDLAALRIADPGATSLLVEYGLEGQEDPRLAIESINSTILEWARTHEVRFDAIGVSVQGSSGELASYAVRRLAVAAQGLEIARSILADGRGSVATQLAPLFDFGAHPYFDAVVVDAEAAEQVLVWLAERDPSKQIFAVARPTSSNSLFDLALPLSRGAHRAYLHVDAPDQQLLSTLEQWNRSLRGDWAADPTADVEVLGSSGARLEVPVITFVRGEDLRTVLVPRGAEAPAIILSLPEGRLTRPRLIDSKGEHEISDTGRRSGRYLVGSRASGPFALVLDQAEATDPNITRESIEVATERGLSVEEIIRNHQSYEAWQQSVERRYIARNTTKLRFELGGAESVEATIAGDYFYDPAGRADWVWEDFFINGVRWKYGRIPELPLIQPEKVTQLPLDIHLSNEYRYSLIRQTELNGYRVFEVRFEPPAVAPEGLPLYRGTVWIDSVTWARVRLSMLQLNLSGEVLSNEERVDFIPFSRATGLPLSASEARAAGPRSLLWLPAAVTAQQVISAAGRTAVVERSTAFDGFRIDPAEFEHLLASVSASDARMVRETASGLRYLEKRDGQRVVKEGFDTARLFLVGGIHHDAGLEFPVVPLGGIDYFNFNLKNTGIQTNVFFAGVVLAANATHPNVGGTRFNLGADLFGIAIPFANTTYRDGKERPEETVKTLPLGLFFRAGHPVLDFGKIDVSFGAAYQNYQRAEETAPLFATPSDTFVFTPGIEFRYARRGYSFGAWYDYNRRSAWEPWGDGSEYDPAHKSFSRYGVSLGKSFFLPRFQRIGVNLNYLDGQRLDRFSKYELGFFGSQRVHGVRSGSVRAETMLIGHLSYGFVFSDQFRLETFYDHAIVDDRSAGVDREPHQGIGIAGQTIGPFGTLLRLDIGKTIGRNAQDGFVANVVFLKLF